MAADGNPEVNSHTGSHRNGGEGQRRMGEMERQIFLEVELYADEENDSPEIKQKKRMARTALALWKEKLEKFEPRILQLELDVRSMQKDVYNLLGFFSVFVGVVFAAVATSNRLECRDFWSPVGLCVLVYAMLVYVTFGKSKAIRQYLKTHRKYRILSRDTTMWIFLLKSRGYADFDFDRDYVVGLHRINPVPSLWWIALDLTIPLTIFTVGLVFSLVYTLCWS